jgi:hypothetical protein
MLKKCSKCNRYKRASHNQELSDFHFKKNIYEKELFYSYCKDCRADYDFERTGETNKDKRNMMLEIKNLIKCEAIHVVGKISHYCNVHRFGMGFSFEFDHKNPKDKNAKIADMLGKTKYSVHDIYNELKKCNVFCCMHHNYRTLVQRVTKSKNPNLWSAQVLDDLELRGVSLVINKSISNYNKNRIKEVYERYN